MQQATQLQNSQVYRIRIPTPFAVGDVYSYLIKDEKIVLVDTGHYSDEAFSIIAGQLNDHGLEVSDIDEIWLTHGHPDHFGQAARLADRAGAMVYGHSKERANFAGNDDGNLFENFFRKQNIPRELVRQMVDQLDWLQQFQLPVEPEWIKDGDTLCSGDLTVTVHHTPGHAPGHLVFLADGNLIFGGDLLLGHISTNALINFDPDSGRRNESLLQYRKSLQWIRKQQGTILPGHGQIIEQPARVADQHLNEHEKRYMKIQQLLKRRPMSLMELSEEMFDDAIKSGAIFLVLSEVLGYLDWGIKAGTIQVDEPRMEYQAVSV